MCSIVPSPPSEITRSSPAANSSSSTPRSREAGDLGFGLGHAHLDAAVAEPLGRGLRERVRERAFAVRDEADASRRAHQSAVMRGLRHDRVQHDCRDGVRARALSRRDGRARGTRRCRRRRGSATRRSRATPRPRVVEPGDDLAQRRRAHVGIADDRRPCRRAPRPASNCGFTSSTSRLSGAVSSRRCGATVRSEMNDRSTTHDRGRRLERAGVERRARWCVPSR